MRRSRLGKCIRNLVLILPLLFLLYAQMEFPPLTVDGMCRQMGRELLMTTPEPVYVVKAGSTWAQNQKDTFVLARSGGSWISFLYEKNSRRGWERSHRLSPQIGSPSILAAYGGNLYLAGNFPAEAVSVAGVATTQKTTIWYDATGKRSPPEFGEIRTFPLTGKPVADGIFCIPYQDTSRWRYDLEDSDYQLGDAAQLWYTGLLEGTTRDDGYSILHADIPIELTLCDAAGTPLDTLFCSMDTYDLFYY